MFFYLAAHEFNRDDVANIIKNLKEHAMTEIKTIYLNQDIT